MKPIGEVMQAHHEQTRLRQGLRQVARWLLGPIALAIIIQPAAFAAPSSSQLTQIPMFMESSAPSNVMFLMDDSQSMMQMQLPTPPGITPSSYSGSIAFTLNRANSITGASTINHGTHTSRARWILKSATLNPAYYNPAIRYLPWKNDGIGMSESNIDWDKNTGNTLTIDSDGFRRGKTLHDPRFAGPNYTTSSAATLAPIVPAGRSGANALAEDTIGGDQSWFSGASSGGFQQDIFSRPMVKTTQSTYCPTYDNSASIVSDPPAYCSSGATPPTTEYASALCPTGYSGTWSTVNPGQTSCPAATETGFILRSPNTRAACSSGTLVAGVCCPSGNIVDPGATNVPCAVGVNCPCAGSLLPTGVVNNCPTGQSCPVVERWVTQPNVPVIAHYFRFEGNNTAVDKADPTKYKFVEIERYDNDDANGSTTLVSSTQLFQIRTADGLAVDVADATVRDDCNAVVSGKKACTWAQEAQNFANWYTYYRNRLFSAIGVTAEALSELTALNMLDSLRLGYGSINYFNGGRDPYAPYAGNGASTLNPWNFSVTATTARTVSDVDASSESGFVSNQGTLVRGVRPFRAGTAERQQVFNWLFSLRAVGATPNREALDSVGRYFSRKDSLGPWAETPGIVNSQPVDQHASCRRSYAILVTDGEWTRTAGGVQPLLENRASPPAWVSSQASSTPLNASSDLSNPVINNGVGPAAGKSFPPVTGQPQFATVTGSPTGTLSDVAYYWWSRDLRPDVFNAIKPQLETSTPPVDADKRNESFWQNVTPYIVGFGLNASMDLPATRAAIVNQTAVTWPSVDGDALKIRDDQCVGVNDVNGKFSGCGRVNDTFRAARVARGDFFAATDIKALAEKVSKAFAEIGEVNGSASGVAGRSSSLAAGDRLFLANFTTGRWSGSLAAYDAISWFDAIKASDPPPTPLWNANFPLWSSRNVMTSVGPGGGSAGGRRLQNISDLLPEAPTQAAALSNDNNLLHYILGDQSREPPNLGAIYRERASLLGDIINSTPLYSKSQDFNYARGSGPKAAQTYSSTAQYKAFVSANASARRAALYVGANDGMLHSFAADSGQELFAYIPRGVYPYLAQLASPSYPHRYFVDGPVVEGHVIFSTNAWKSVVVGLGGAGTKSVFALDVSAPDSFSASNVMWDRMAGEGSAGDSPSTAYQDIGNILTPGVVGSAKDGKWYYFVGNGVESESDKARLLMFNMQTGDLISLAPAVDDDGGPNLSGAVTGRLNGLGGVAPVYDADRNVVAIYAGDRLGRMWKFDLAKKSDGSPITSTGELAAVRGKKLFTATDSSSNRQPITAAPRLMPHPFGGRYVIFGTGKFYDSADKLEASVQSVYALWERDTSLVTPVDIGGRAALEQLTLQPPSGTPEFRSISGVSNINFGGTTPDAGWYFDLSVSGAATGERIITRPVDDGYGYAEVTSYEPLAQGDPCRGGGNSYFYRLDIAGTFRRLAFSGRNVADVGAPIAPTFAPVASLRKQAPNVGTPGTFDPKDIFKRPPPPSPGDCPPGFNNPITATPEVVPVKACGIPSLRAWRELPRGSR